MLVGGLIFSKAYIRKSRGHEASVWSQMHFAAEQQIVKQYSDVHAVCF